MIRTPSVGKRKHCQVQATEPSYSFLELSMESDYETIFHSRTEQKIKTFCDKNIVFEEIEVKLDMGESILVEKGEEKEEKESEESEVSNDKFLNEIEDLLTERTLNIWMR